MLALVSLRAGRPDEALASADAAVEAARAAADDWEEGITLSTRAAVLARQGQLADAQRTFEAALDVLADNNGWGLAQTWYGLGSLARARGDYVAAAEHFSSALAKYRQIDARPEIARCLAGLAWVALAEQDLGLAAASLAECLQLSLATGQRLAIARGIQAAAVLAALRDEPARTARLEGAAVALLEALGHAPSASARSRSDQLLESARRGLGEPAVAQLLAEGAAMTADQAVRCAIGARPAPDRAGGQLPDGAGGPSGNGTAPAPGGPGPAHAQFGSSVLTAREREIAVLIARGLSNRGIAEELVISPATAARHVANIFTKLGLRSRAQVAAWVTEAQHRGTG